ncbi:MAG: PKD domain-containing protein [Methanospirillum sp.]
MKAFYGVLILLLLCVCVQAVTAEKYVQVDSWGNLGSGAGQFTDPRFIAVDGGGNVYVTDYSGYTVHRVQKFASDGTYLGGFGSYGSGPGQFMWPEGIAVDGAGTFYIADSHRIQQFLSIGLWVSEWGTAGSGLGELSAPRGVALDSTGNIYVVDSGNNRVQMYLVGSHLCFLEWGDLGYWSGYFDSPTGIAINGYGDVYVADSGNDRVQRFDKWGTFEKEWGTDGYDDGDFRYPAGIAVDAAGDVYVTDYERSLVQKFSWDGDYITGWGVNEPWGVAVDGAGYVYVVSRGNHNVRKYARALEPDFTATPISGAAPLTVQFTDGTTNGVPESWTWTFGDGQTSNLKNPSHTYAEPGSYDVTLTVSSTAQGSNAVTKTDYIVANPPLVPDFTLAPYSGYAPVTVQFTDATTGGEPTSWSWTFGDGGTSHMRNPSHTYTLAGSYDVTLTVSSPTQGSRTKTKTDILRVFPPLEPDFTAAPRTGFEPLAVQFTDTTTGGSHVCLWEFGDGTTSLQLNPRHVYQEDGEYTVKLTVTSAELGGTTSVTKTDYITVLPLWNGLMRIEAEAFDRGGEGVAYHDTTHGNSGGVYNMLDDVDIIALMPSGYAVTDTVEGEWTRYTVLSQKSSNFTYPFSLRVKATARGRSIDIIVNGVGGGRAGSVVVPNTLGFTWVNTTVELVPGANTIRFLHHDTSTIGSPELDFDYFALDPNGVSTPGVVTVPGGAGLPTDTDADGLYDDINGNGRKDFADVVLYFNQMSWIAANEPVVLFDFNSNGRIDFADVVWLFNNL